MTTAIDTAQKWYAELAFPHQYDDAFATLAEKYPTLPEIDLDKQRFGDDKGLNLLQALSHCRALEEMYLTMGIPRTILIDTLQDIVIWTNTHYTLTGELGLAEANWIRHALLGKLFRLGRLEFRMEVNHHAAGPLAADEPVIGVHIPRGGPLTPDECHKSLNAAREFFAAHFPAFSYRYFTCHSWLLDDTLRRYLRPDANILRFGEMFRVVARDESDDVLKYAINWSATRETIDRFKPTNAFTGQILQAVRDGEKFYAALGYIEK